MHGDNGALGVMGTPNVAMRDPLFYKWHKVSGKKRDNKIL